MKVNLEVIKENKIFFIASSAILIVAVFVSLIFDNKNMTYLEETDLEESGESVINKLVINEYMSSNKGALVDSEGNSYDWIELYNGTNHATNLKNYGLSDDENKIKWVFPDVVIEAKGYLIIYLSSENKEGMYANFKLSSNGGEVLALKNANGKTIDAITTIATTKNQSVARNTKGQWFVTSMSTPRYVNTLEGYNELHNSLIENNNGIKINEILPKNNGNFLTENNKLYGYVELINESNNEINIKNYYLSNSENELYKYKIPELILKPSEVVLVYMDTSYDESNLYSGFDLDNKEGKVLLSNNVGKIIDKLEYSDVPNGIALVKNKDMFVKTTAISPGYNNTNDGIEEFSKKYLKNKDELIINEVMNDNNSFMAQNGYEFYDWIELYNNSKESINLSDYTLTTTTNNSKMYNLPDKVLKSGEFYILMASGDINLSNNKYVHTNFKLSEVESLYLYKKGSIVDSVMIANIPLNYSLGRNNQNGFFYIEKPTPGKSNNVGVRDISYAPTFSLEPGIYNDTKSLEIKLNGPGTIYYTLDGNDPTVYSNKYNNPINISKTTVIKAISYESGKIKSNITTSSYIVNENHTLPIVSLSVNQKNYNLITNNAFAEIEVQGYIELYEEDKSFSLPCSLSLFGGSARGLKKKSFGIRFKSEYGADKLVYPLFDNRDTSVYQSFVLRSGSQDYDKAFIRDILATSLVDDYTDLDVQAYKNSILYINGKYWGIYNIREKINKDYIANTYNVDPKKSNIIQGKYEVTFGDGKNYFNLLNYVRSNNMAVQSNYDYVKTKLDITSFIDFWIAELYTTNNDVINNRQFYHPDIDNGKVKFVFFDLDWAFYNYPNNYYTFMTNPEGMSEYEVDASLMINLMKNNEFRTSFLDRLSYNMKNTWKKENVLKRLDEIYNNIYPEMERNQLRWGLTMNDWIECIDKLKEYINKRNDYILKHTKSYFNLTDKQMEEYFGGDDNA